MQQRGGLIRTQTQREKAVQIGALNTKMHAEKGVHHRERECVLTQKGLPYHGTHKRTWLNVHLNYKGTRRPYKTDFAKTTFSPSSPLV